MADTLTREPLLTSLSFIDGHYPDLEAARADDRDRPLAYAYSQWDGIPASPQFGHFDEDTQTWVSPPGLPTAGITTYTRTNCYSTDRCVDDVCA
ncbi:hypothetical protein [Spirillospora sp. NPDC047279]|uniref:hypothetical protein n=1 Tax=Spirillospora sp. NPDC047279 TaxID=3155478 RepID=UPI0033F1FD2C